MDEFIVFRYITNKRNLSMAILACVECNLFAMLTTIKNTTDSIEHVKNGKKTTKVVLCVFDAVAYTAT